MRFPPLLALALLGCQQASAPEPREPDAPAARAVTADAPDAPTPPPANEPITEAHILVGEYRVAGVDDAEIDLPHGVTARITIDGIHVASDCVNLSWNYVFSETRLVTEPLHPRDSCGRALLPEEQAIVTAFNRADQVGRTPANGIQFEGDGHSVVLFSQ